MTITDRVRNQIKNDIQAGIFPPGSRLPTRHRLMERYSIARASVDKVIKQLINEDLLESKQGSGTFVSSDLKLENSDSNNDSINLYMILNSEIRCTESGYLEDYWSQALESYKGNTNSNVLPMNSLKVRLHDLTKSRNNRIIWSRPPLTGLSYIDELKRAKTPQIMINRNFPQHNFITTDSYEGIHRALSLAIDKLGEKTAVMFSAPSNPNMPFLSEREIAYHEACIDLDIKSKQVCRAISPQSSHLIQAAKDALSSGSPIIYINDYDITPYLLSLADSMGRTLGQNLFLITTDWIEEELATPGIICIKQAWDTMFEYSIQWATQPSPVRLQKLVAPKIISQLDLKPKINLSMTNNKNLAIS